jgi:hypothetical protein
MLMHNHLHIYLVVCRPWAMLLRGSQNYISPLFGDTLTPNEDMRSILSCTRYAIYAP